MSDPNQPAAPGNDGASAPEQPTNPYGQPPQYSQPQSSQPQYGQTPSPYGGQPVDPDKRPGTVTAAAIITLVLSGLTLVAVLFGVVGLIAVRDDFIDEFRGNSGMADLDPNAAFVGALVALVVFAIWCVAAIVLAVLTMRRSKIARILLVVSSVMTALVSLLAIFSLVSGLTLIAGVAVTIMLFTGGANEWFANRGQDPAVPTGTPQPL